MDEYQVVVVGAGPTGMMLAAELTLVGIDVVVLERRETFSLESARSKGLHARTLEVLDQRGVVERFLEAGTAAQVQGFGGIRLDIIDFPTRYNHGLALPQSQFEPLLAEWLDELDVRILRGREVTGISQADTSVAVSLADATTIRAQYVVGCDGGRSTIRKLAGIDFVGWDASTRWITGEVEMERTPEFGLRGGGGIGPAQDGRIGVTLTLPTVEDINEPTIEDLREALIRVDGNDYGVHSPHWLSTFTDTTRQATTYRKGRVLIAGDAAHVHAPLGGQGLNIGVQDAVNLGWKLAQVITGTSPEELLDTYTAERHPVAARVLQNTMAQRALTAGDDRTTALRAILSETITMDEPRKHLAGMISGLDVTYDLGEGHPLLGRRIPDLDLHTETETIRLYSLLHNARPILLNLEPVDTRIDLTAWIERGLQYIDAIVSDGWELPVIGDVPPPSAVFIRPDGHVAWVENSNNDDLKQALTTWLGPPG